MASFEYGSSHVYYVRITMGRIFRLETDSERVGSGHPILVVSRYDHDLNVELYRLKREMAV